MKSMQETKIEIKKQVMAVLNRDGSANAQVLAASLALEHGLSSRTVSSIIKDMILAEYLQEDKGILKTNGRADHA